MPNAIVNARLKEYNKSNSNFNAKEVSRMPHFEIFNLTKPKISEYEPNIKILNNNSNIQ